MLGVLALFEATVFLGLPMWIWAVIAAVGTVLLVIILLYMFITRGRLRARRPPLGEPISPRNS